MSSPFEETRDGHGVLRVHVVPRASRSKFCGVHGDALKIAVAAAPVDGKANKAVIVLLAKLLAVRKQDLALQSGDHSRTKSFVFFTLGKNDLEARIQSILRDE